MLILTRRVGESVVIGDDVSVTILGVKDNQVRIGVTAPMDVSVHRQEIYERIKKEEAGEPAPEQAPESGEPPTEETGGRRLDLYLQSPRRDHCAPFRPARIRRVRPTRRACGGFEPRPACRPRQRAANAVSERPP